MVFQYGNQINTKLDTLELKLEAYKQYCEHLRKGKSKKSWRMHHPDVCVTWQTLEEYIKNEPNVFNPIQMQQAQIDGYAHWEEVVEHSAKGINEKANTASLQMVMRNKFGWDKDDKKENSASQPLVVELIKKIREE